MSATDDAIARLVAGTYNSGSYDASTNAGGFGAGGHRVAFPAALQDVGLAAQAAGEANLHTIVSKAGTALAPVEADSGAIWETTATSPVTVTVPAGLPTGWHLGLVMGAAGTVTIAAAEGVTLLEADDRRVLATVGHEAWLKVLPSGRVHITGSVV